MAKDVMVLGEAVHEVSNAEGFSILDTAPRHCLGISGGEFLRAWKEGRFQNGASSDPGATYFAEK